MIHAHEARLNQIAEANHLRPLSGSMSPGVYLGYAMDLALVGLGLLKPSDIVRPVDVYEEYKDRTGCDWPNKT